MITIALRNIWHPCRCLSADNANEIRKTPSERPKINKKISETQDATRVNTAFTHLPIRPAASYVCASLKP
jgi:hypothetical protein